jgi:hypothetical protein
MTSERELLTALWRAQRRYINSLEGIIATGQSVTPKTMQHKMKRAQQQIMSLEQEIAGKVNEASKELYRETILEVGPNPHSLRKTINWNAVPKEEIKRLATMGTELMKNYTDDIIKQVNTQLQLSLLNGESYTEAFERIKPIGNATARPKVMIRDQMARVYHHATVAAYGAWGNPQDFTYDWVGPDDARTTDVCRERKEGNPYTWEQVQELDPHPHIQCRHRWVANVVPVMDETAEEEEVVDEKPAAKRQPRKDVEVPYPMIADTNVTEERLAQMEKAAAKHGMTLEQYDKALGDEMAKIIERSEFRTKIPNESVLNSILDDGRIRTQFETNTSMGGIDHSGREMCEEKLFGFPSQETMYEECREAGFDPYSDEGKDWLTEHGFVDYEMRPVYGYLSDTGDGSHECSLYGSIDLVLDKDAMLDRTTYACGDTLYLQDTDKPGLCSDPDGFSLNNRFTVTEPWGEPKETALEIMQKTDNLSDLKRYNYSKGQGSMCEFIELQYHGQVTVAEIKEVRVHYPHEKLDPETEKRLRELGINVSYTHQKTERRM